VVHHQVKLQLQYQSKTPIDNEWSNIANNPLDMARGAQLPYNPGKTDTLSNMYPIQQGGNTVGHVPIKAQTVRPQIMGPKAKPVLTQLPQDVQGIEGVKMAYIKKANAIANFTNAAKGVGKAVMGNPVGRNAIAGAGVGAAGAGLSGGNPLTGAIAGAGIAGGGTALKMRGLGTNPGVKSLTGKLPSQTRMLPAPPQPQAAPVNISPGVQLMT
jgi:hypothetical protein